MRGNRFAGGVAGSLLLAALAGVALARGGGKGPGGKDDGVKAKVNDTVDLAGDWVYDDVDQGVERAKAGNKPLCIVFR